MVTKTKSMKFELTNSQRMAVCDILGRYSMLADEPQTFVDVSSDAETSVGELLRIFVDIP